MVPAIHARRGRCLHRPETLRAEPAGINLPLCSRTFGPMRASAPTRAGRFYSASWHGRIFQGSPPHPALRGHPLQAGEGRDSPHPSRAAPGPPSPEGKASSGGGMIPAASSGGGMIPAASSGGVLQYQPFQGFFQFFLVYAGIIDDQAVQVCGLGINGAEGLDLQALGEECLGQGFVR